MALDITQYPIILDIMLDRFEAQMPFFASISNQYATNFEGFKSGNTAKIELTPKYISTDGFDFDPQTLKKETADIVVDTEKTVAVDMTAVDLTLNYDAAKLQRDFVDPATSVLARDVENSINQQYLNISHNVGTAGTLPSTFANFYEPIQELVRLGIAPSQITGMLGVDETAKILDYIDGLNQPEMVKAAVREAFVGKFGGATILQNLFRPTHTAGGFDANYVTNGADQGGDGNIIVATGTGTILKGDVFTIADTKAWNYATNQTTGILKDHVVDTNYAGGAGTVSIKNNLIASSTNAYRNVDALAATAKSLVISATHKVNLYFAKRAFAAAIVPLAPMSSAPMRVTRTSPSGISMTLSTDYTFGNETEGTKLMVLFGTATTDDTAALRLKA